MLNVISFTTETCTTDIQNRLIEFCNIASNETTRPAHVNMSPDRTVGSLLHLLFEEKRFSNDTGILFAIVHNNDIVAVSGIYRSDFSKDIAIGGVRSWTLKEFRGRHIISTNILPKQYDWAIDTKKKMFVLTFNSYNEKLMRIMSRTGKYKNKALQGMGYTRPDFCQDLMDLPYEVMVKGVPQKILYKKIDDSFEFDWETVKHNPLI